MEKQKLGTKSVLYPYPVTMVGADIDGKPNFMTISFIGICNAKPGMIALGAHPSHHTNKGILKNRTFSVNLPHKDMMEVTDYVGLVTGKKTDKSDLFNVFYGELENAPMISECPINIECKVREVLEIGGIDLIIIGEIVESYCTEEFLTDGKPDIEKMQPFLLSMYDNRFFSIGNEIGKAWKEGKNYNKEASERN